jgi:integrase
MGKKRRGPNEGSIYRRKDGRWVGQIHLGYDLDGKPKRLYIYGKTRREVAERVSTILAERAKGVYVPPHPMTVEEWARKWLDMKKVELRPKTIQLYFQELSLAIPELRGQGPGLGLLRLQEVKPVDIQNLLSLLAQEGYAERTLKKVFILLRTLFEEAVRLELLARNPLASLRPPKVSPKEEAPRKAGRTLEPSEVRALLKAAQGHPLELFFRLLLSTGLRKGEALGLKWKDVDLERGELSVSRSWVKLGGGGVLSGPKTPRSRRIVPIPKDLIPPLKARYQARIQAVGEEAAREEWVFPGEDGEEPIHPDYPNHALRRLCEKAGIPPVRVHDLRHTYGSLLLARGVPLEVVSERLGHASYEITLRVYRHVLEEERRGHVLTLAEMIGEEPSRPQA